MLLAFLRSSLSSLLGQLAAREHDDRRLAQARILLDLRQQLEAGHVRQPQIEHHAVEAAAAQGRERRGTGAGGGDLDVAVCRAAP